MYAFRDTVDGVDLAFTDRHGGVSSAPYDTLNLSISGQDDAEAKAENHRLLLAAFAPGADCYADVYQEHGNTVHVVEDRRPSDRPHADGIVTAQAGLPILVRAADCVPVLLADPEVGVVGAAHAGRRGVEAGVVPATVAAMRELGADRIQGWIGPHICAACYEVPESMRAAVAGVIPSTWGETRWGTPSLDLGAGVTAQLVQAGVEVHDVSVCTAESDDLFSYRRDGEHSGRLAGIIRIVP